MYDGAQFCLLTIRFTQESIFPSIRLVDTFIMSSTSGLSFDLEAYIGRYPAQSETRLQRLFFIYNKAHDSNDKELCSQAKTFAVEQIRSTGNIKRYKELLSSCPPDEQDQEWILQMTRESQVALKTLLGRLSTAQAHLNKEAIRLAYLALCDFHRPRGDLEEAMRVALRSREYCTTRSQTAHVCLLIMELAMDMRKCIPTLLSASLPDSDT